MFTWNINHLARRQEVKPEWMPCFIGIQAKICLSCIDLSTAILWHIPIFRPLIVKGRKGENTMEWESPYEWKSSNSALATEIGTTGHWRKICICSCTNTVHKWTLHESFGKTPRENVRQLTPIKGKISISIEWRSISRYVNSCIFAISYLSVLCNSRFELNS